MLSACRLFSETKGMSHTKFELGGEFYLHDHNNLYTRRLNKRNKVHRFRGRRLPEYRLKIKVASIGAILQATYCGGG